MSSPAPTPKPTVTATYSEAAPDLAIDAYVPPNATGPLSAVIAFHGGGMTAGGKRDMFFPYYLIPKLHTYNIILISANYRLLRPSTPADITTDVRDLFTYLSADDTELSLGFAQLGVSLDPSRLAVLGISGGNYAARAAATLLDILPRPRAWVSLYGMAGDFTLDHWVQPSQPPPWVLARVAEKVDALEQDGDGEPTGDAALAIAPQFGGVSDPLNRVGLFVDMYVRGTLLDYITSEPGLSASLRAIPVSERYAVIPRSARAALLPVSPSTIPAFFIHGTVDNVVSPAESVQAVNDLEAVGVEVDFKWVRGATHGLLDPEARPPAMAQGGMDAVDAAVAFVVRKLDLAATV